MQSQAPPSSDTPLPGPVATELVRLFKLLSDETRLRILFFLLENKELNVRALCDRLHQSQPAVSHHLALLRTDGLIACRREGKHNFYHVLPDRFHALLGMFFQSLPRTGTEIRFRDWVFSQSNGG